MEAELQNISAFLIRDSLEDKLTSQDLDIIWTGGVSSSGSFPRPERRGSPPIHVDRRRLSFAADRKSWDLRKLFFWLSGGRGRTRRPRQAVRGLHPGGG